MEKAYVFDVLSKIYVAQDEHEVTAQMYEVCFDMIDVAIDISAIYGCSSQAGGVDEVSEEDLPAIADEGTPPDEYPGSGALVDEEHSFPFDSDSYAVIRLDSKQVLYLREVNKYLALVCLLREDSFKKIGLINYNVLQFKKLIKGLLIFVSLVV